MRAGGHTRKAEAAVRNLFERAGITVGGRASHDLHVHDPRFYRRVLQDGSLGLGESFVEGWWDGKAVDAVIHRILVGNVWRAARRSPRVIALALAARLGNPQSLRRAAGHARSHYERGLDLFETMLDRRLTYSCGFWDGARTLDEAQEAKLELICKKLGLHEGMTLLDIGCGWGSLIRYAAERHGVRATGITVSPEQVEIARTACRGLPVEVRLQDYRTVRGRYDAVVSVGMVEHVGHRNYRAYMEAVDRCLAPGGLSLLHTIAGNAETRHLDPWLHQYIFPGANLPTLAQLARAAEGLFVVEDVHNLGPHYDRTLMAWHCNLEAGWPRLREGYSEDFRRRWTYYLLASAGAFRARHVQLLQLLVTRPGTARPAGADLRSVRETRGDGAMAPESPARA